MIDAPLEKILEDDCRDQALELLREMNTAAVMPAPLEVAAMIRTIAVGLDLPPPVGAALKIYHRVLGQLPLALLRQATELITKTYSYSTFPKPAEWVSRCAEHQRLLERGRFMIQIYEQRRKVAEFRYGKEAARRRDAARRSSERPVPSVEPEPYEL